MINTVIIQNIIPSVGHVTFLYTWLPLYGTIWFQSAYSHFSKRKVGRGQDQC